jgi:hypothetical protein
MGRFDCIVRNLCLFYYRPLSLDEGLQKEPDTPGSASKMRKGSVFGSLEKVFNMLTPKKQRSSSTDGPRKVKVRTKQNNQ